MEKIQFTDPDTNEVVEFAVEEQTQLNGITGGFSRWESLFSAPRVPWIYWSAALGQS